MFWSCAVGFVLSIAFSALFWKAWVYALERSFTVANIERRREWIADANEMRGCFMWSALAAFVFLLLGVALWW